MSILLSLAVLPATLLQLKLQHDSVGLVYNLFETSNMTPTLDQFLSRLKEDAKENPEKEQLLKTQFREVFEVKRTLESFFLMRSSIENHLRWQTIYITVGILLISILGSLLISHGIVRQVKQLIKDRERAHAKVRDLNALQNWQAVARTLVHELRAPITPIKLISSDLERKFQNLSREEFAKYLIDAQRLMNEQVQSIESMMAGFTKFGRLPPPELAPASLPKFVTEFCSNYNEAFGDQVNILAAPFPDDISANIDAKLLRDLLFNLCKNAAEANAGQTSITLVLSSAEGVAHLQVRNIGRPIPEELKEKLFEPYTSSKLGAESSNMGLGLTISKKIALDHGGDLILMDDGRKGEVVFRLELPVVK